MRTKPRASSQIPVNFLGIGAQRAATTWVFECLREHPQVFMPVGKELHFFADHFDRGMDWYGAQFRGHAGQPAVGELSPSYLDKEQAIPNIAALVPHARLFAILREPVERAYSAYRLLQLHYPLIRELTFEQTLERDPAIINCGMYATHLRRVYQYFPQDRVRVFLYEDVMADPAGVFASLCRFIGVNDQFRPPSLTKHYNVIAAPRAQRWLERIGLAGVVKTLKDTRLGEWLKQRRALRGGSAEKKVHANTRQRLKAIYRDEILAVEEILGRDLSTWL